MVAKGETGTGCVIAVDVPAWGAVRVFHSVTADDFGVGLVPFPVELGDEIAVEGHPSPLEVVDVVWAPPGREGSRRP